MNSINMKIYRNTKNIKCGYYNNNAKTSMVDYRNIKSTSMETCLSANSKFTIKHKKM